MASVCLYFHIHQPYRLRNYTIFDQDSNYFDDTKNAEICRKVAKKCYLPSNLLILELIKKYNGKFKISYSITGVMLEQIEQYAPEVLSSFQQLAGTGCVEFLAETYYHSLSFLYSVDEFAEQVETHRQTVQRLFGQLPRVFRNTELIYYMCTKYFADGDVHKYFNPYDSPYDCYISFMNVLNDLSSRCRRALRKQLKSVDIAVEKSC